MADDRVRAAAAPSIGLSAPPARRGSGSTRTPTQKYSPTPRRSTARTEAGGSPPSAALAGRHRQGDVARHEMAAADAARTQLAGAHAAALNEQARREHAVATAADAVVAEMALANAERRPICSSLCSSRSRIRRLSALSPGPASSRRRRVSTRFPECRRAARCRRPSARRRALS
jgi:hypothetical protein